MHWIFTIVPYGFLFFPFSFLRLETKNGILCLATFARNYAYAVAG